ncbi:hypothetical protein OH146_06355 [Salinibacterium sp. SYSU T00001]|uniref:hypothetical protein n=1 Tax=Homoserinimonas sedimenticola TaxID=2986805 RepID=UPI002235AD7D|nr:hypothetical protein [Salinibacterium sedimenticola]MCW4385393.1 hypothetical protein [Salinibacterium sedimenticola]
MFIGRIAVIALALLAIAALLVAVVLLARRRGPDSESRPLVLVVGRFVAAAYACITLIVTLVTVITTLAAEQVAVTIPVREFWPEPYPWIVLLDGPTADVTGGGFRSADVVLAGLGIDARAFLAAGHAVQGATFIVIAITIALLCQRLLADGGGFATPLTRAVTLTGATVAAGGIVWQVLFAIGGSIASEQALRVSGWTSENAPGPDQQGLDPQWEGTPYDPLATGLPEPTIFAQLDFWPILLGLALAAVAFAFRRGERLQRDTEGLV